MICPMTIHTLTNFLFRLPYSRGLMKNTTKGTRLTGALEPKIRTQTRGGEGEVAPHPLFASVEGSGSLGAKHQQEYDDDDSDDDDPDPTLFGRRPTDPPPDPNGRLRMMGDIVDTFHGGRLEDAAIYESPTPWQGKR